MYNAEILLDSINASGSRLTTMRVTMPRFILAEFNTHRAFSRNAASSRALPIAGRIQQVRTNPFIPDVWGKNQRGMQSSIQLEEQDAIQAEYAWIGAANAACDFAERLNRLGVHKQLANRLLEPFLWVTVIVSSTEWQNFFNLRDSDLAQPEMQLTAQSMRKALDASTPRKLVWYDWHVPLAEGLENLPLEQRLLAAAGRIARVSYETSGKTIDEDITLGQSLLTNQHMSPFEHIAKVYEISGVGQARNYQTGWYQYRAWIEHRLKVE